RDGLGRITKKSESFGSTSEAWRFVYDLAGRLDAAYRSLNGGPETLFDYNYDANGNHTRIDHVGASCTADPSGDVDNQDRLLKLTCTDASGTYILSYIYTANGELLTKTDSRAGTTTYGYDVRGNLVKVTLPNADAIEYLIDGRDRRVAKKKNGVL